MWWWLILPFYQSGWSSTQKLSCNITLLNRCTTTETRWKRKWTSQSSPDDMEIRFRDIWLYFEQNEHIFVTTLTFQGHVTSSGMWPFDILNRYTQYNIFYRCSIVTESLSPAVFEIMGPKHNGFTILTFQGHVTSYVVSNWWPIATKPLSPSVFEILGSKAPILRKSSLRCAILRGVYNLSKSLVHILVSVPTLPIQCDTFVGFRWRIRDVNSWAPMFNAKSSNFFLSPKNCHMSTF